MDKRFDFLIIGSGVAGLFYAVKVAELVPNARIAIVTKKAETATSTNRAQGGIAAALAQTDSVQTHIADTLRLGCGLSRPEVVEQVVQAGPAAIAELMDLGVKFTRVDGQYDLGREGGHTQNRVVHAADLTGREIERALLKACRSKRRRIEIFRDTMVVDLITGQQAGKLTCLGAQVLSEKTHTMEIITAPVTLLATGGLGMVYYHTSNPKIATGDGVAIAYRAGVSVANLEFVQFHPTTLFSPGRWPFLISEAVRGEGGRLVSVSGRYIMDGAHELGDLAPRDVVAREIDRELKTSGEDYVLLDISHRDPEFVRKRFPNIYRQCLRYGFDICRRPVPVVPAAHYACGGVVCRLDGKTELPGLYVAGEVAMTGMHGANRLASNSLLEAVVMAKHAAVASVGYFHQIAFTQDLTTDHPGAGPQRVPHAPIVTTHDRRELNLLMSDYVGIVRSLDRLQTALNRVKQIRATVEEQYRSTPSSSSLIELRNLAMVAELIVLSALKRRESRGLHYLEDIPQTDERFAVDTVLAGQPQERAND